MSPGLRNWLLMDMLIQRNGGISMLYDLNEKENMIYSFICDYMKDKGYSPTVREIGESVGLKSTSSVHIYLKRLEERGYIVRRSECPRAIKVV